MNKIIYAEDVNYFHTSTSQADTWIERAKKEIARLPNAKITGDAYGSFDGRVAYALTFTIVGDAYKAVWPVLQSRKGNERRRRCKLRLCCITMLNISA